MARRQQTLGSSKTGWATTVWLDPGGTTGWAVMSVDPSVLVGDSPIEKNITHWACGEITGNLNQQASECMGLLDLWEDAAAGIENFQLRQMAVDLSPVQLTAKIEYALWLTEKWEAIEDGRPMGRGRYVYKQMPAMAKQTLTDDRQREYKLWEPGKDHKRDAVKHAYTFLQRCQEKPTLRASAWPTLFLKDGRVGKRVPPTSKRSKY